MKFYNAAVCEEQEEESDDDKPWGNVDNINFEEFQESLARDREEFERLVESMSKIKKSLTKP